MREARLSNSDHDHNLSEQHGSLMFNQVRMVKRNTSSRTKGAKYAEVEEGDADS